MAGLLELSGHRGMEAIALRILISIHIALASKGLRLRVHYAKYYTTRKTVLPHRA